MKIRRVVANNRKKVLVIETGAQTFEYPYSALTVRPSKRDPLIHVEADRELGNTGLLYRLRSGVEGAVLLDQVKDYLKDPAYLCEALLYTLSIRAQKELYAKRVPKRELARRLKTSPKQLDRLFDQSFYGKTINQMIKLLHVLGVNVELRVKEAA